MIKLCYLNGLCFKKIVFYHNLSKIFRRKKTKVNLLYCMAFNCWRRKSRCVHSLETSNSKINKKFQPLPNNSTASGLFLYLLKTSENLWFPDVFRGYRKRSLTWNGLTHFMPVFHFYTSWKLQKTNNKYDLFKGYRNGTLGLNGSIKNKGPQGIGKLPMSEAYPKTQQTLMNELFEATIYIF